MSLLDIFALIRRVMIRMQAWLGYINAQMNDGTCTA
jgi:hypothetical protein